MKTNVKHFRNYEYIYNPKLQAGYYDPLAVAFISLKVYIIIIMTLWVCYSLIKFNNESQHE